MKANQQIRLTHDTRAQVGIGTMIVFIATILVAATAAAVLLDTSGKLQERSSSTGNEATKHVASNVVLTQVVGQSNAGGTQLDTLTLTVSLAPGASQVDLAQLKIRASDGSVLKTLTHGGTANATHFSTTFLRDHDTTAPVMITGDLVNVVVAMNAAGMPVTPRQSVSIVLLPEVGSQLDASFTAPPSWSASAYVVLR
jgi:archaeal flagellin FlaB